MLLKAKRTIIFLQIIIIMMVVFLPTLTLAQASTNANTTPAGAKFQLLDPLAHLQVKIPGLDKLAEQYKASCEVVGVSTQCTLPWISIYIKGIFNYAMSIIGVLSAITLMIGGVIYLVSGGNATRISEAKSWITASITGLVLGLTSYMLLNEVNPGLLGLKPVQLQVVEEIPPQEGQKVEILASLSTEDCGGVSVAWPTKSHPISSRFIRADGVTFHGGTDFSIPSGTPVLSSSAGTVSIAEPPKTVEKCATVMIKTQNLYFTYLHLSRVDVKVGDPVVQGQQIGLSGGDKGSIGSCKTTGPHLHFQIKKNEYNWGGFTSAASQPNFIDPLKCLPH